MQTSALAPQPPQTLMAQLQASRPAQPAAVRGLAPLMGLQTVDRVPAAAEGAAASGAQHAARRRSVRVAILEWDEALASTGPS